MQKAIDFAQTNLKQYLNLTISFPTLDRNGQQRLIHVSSVTTLICFSPVDLLKATRGAQQLESDDLTEDTSAFGSSQANDFSFLMTDQQRLVIADMINNEFLRHYNKIEDDQPLYSNMEMVMKHLYLCLSEAGKIGRMSNRQFRFPAE